MSANNAFDFNQIATQVSTNLSTVGLVCPEGEWVGIIGQPVDGNVASWLSVLDIKKGKRAGQSVVKLSVPIEITSPEALAQVKRERLVVFYETFLDFGPNGQIASGEGENIGLGRLYDVCGMKASGQIASLPGKGPFKLIVKHRVEDDGSRFADIKRLSKL